MSSPPPKTSEPAARWERTRANVKTIGGAFLLAIIIRIALFEAFEIEGPSMEPTLLNGDRVVVAKFSYGLFLPWTNHALVNWGMPEVGDVVILKNPHDNVDIVKRVIALPGDTVEVREDVVYRNGAPIDHTDLGLCADLLDYLDHSLADCWEERIGSERYRTSRAGPSPGSPPITVPPDHFFVLGDHRDHSNDSRFFGAVHKEKLKGRALSIYWSSDSEEGIRWSRLFKGID